MPVQPPLEVALGTCRFTWKRASDQSIRQFFIPDAISIAYALDELRTAVATDPGLRYVERAWLDYKAVYDRSTTADKSSDAALMAELRRLGRSCQRLPNFGDL